MSSTNIEFKSSAGTFNVDQAQGIVECFVAGIGNKDSVGDVLIPGAFKESLKRRKPRVVWGHNWNDPIGKVLEIYEVPPSDARLPMKMKAAGIGGLYARVQFNLSSEKGKEAFANVSFFGEEQEWSIGYKTLLASFDQNLQANILKEVELYEVSPVLHGANQLTGTISVKSDDSEEKCPPEEMPGMGQPGMNRPMQSVKPRIPSMPENPLMVSLRRELAQRSGSNVIIRSMTENMAVFDRITSDGMTSTYRVPYHFSGDSFMFGKPERVSALMEDSNPAPSAPQVPMMPQAVTYGNSGPDFTTIASASQDEEKTLEDEITDFLLDGIEGKVGRTINTRNLGKLKNVVQLLQDVISSSEKEVEVKSDLIIEIEPENAFAAKSLLDPIMDYHRVESHVSTKGIVITSGVTQEFIDAVETMQKSLGARIGKRVGSTGGGGATGKVRGAGRALTGTFDPNAVDADGDKLVQEGTAFERPATPHAVRDAKKIERGLRSGELSPGDKEKKRKNREKQLITDLATMWKERKQRNVSRASYGRIEHRNDEIAFAAYRYQGAKTDLPFLEWWEKDKIDNGITYFDNGFGFGKPTKEDIPFEYLPDLTPDKTLKPESRLPYGLPLPEKLKPKKGSGLRSQGKPGDYSEWASKTYKGRKKYSVDELEKHVAETFSNAKTDKEINEAVYDLNYDILNTVGSTVKDHDGTPEDVARWEKEALAITKKIESTQKFDGWASQQIRDIAKADGPRKPYSARDTYEATGLRSGNAEVFSKDDLPKELVNDIANAAVRAVGRNGDETRLIDGAKEVLANLTDEKLKDSVGTSVSNARKKLAEMLSDENIIEQFDSKQAIEDFMDEVGYGIQKMLDSHVDSVKKTGTSIEKEEIEEIVDNAKSKFDDDFNKLIKASKDFWDKRSNPGKRFKANSVEDAKKLAAQDRESLMQSLRDGGGDAEDLEATLQSIMPDGLWKDMSEGIISGKISPEDFNYTIERAIEEINYNDPSIDPEELVNELADALREGASKDGANPLIVALAKEFGDEKITGGDLIDYLNGSRQDSVYRPDRGKIEKENIRGLASRSSSPGDGGKERLSANDFDKNNSLTENGRKKIVDHLVNSGTDEDEANSILDLWEQNDGTAEEYIQKYGKDDRNIIKNIADAASSMYEDEMSSAGERGAEKRYYRNENGGLRSSSTGNDKNKTPFRSMDSILAEMTPSQRKKFEKDMAKAREDFVPIDGRGNPSSPYRPNPYSGLRSRGEGTMLGRPGQIQRDENGKINSPDAKNMRKEHDARVFSKLRELGFNDDEIELLTGVPNGGREHPASEKVGLSSKSIRPDSGVKKYSIRLLEEKRDALDDSPSVGVDRKQLDGAWADQVIADLKDGNVDPIDMMGIMQVAMDDIHDKLRSPEKDTNAIDERQKLGKKIRRLLVNNMSDDEKSSSGKFSASKTGLGSRTAVAAADGGRRNLELTLSADERGELLNEIPMLRRHAKDEAPLNIIEKKLRDAKNGKISLTEEEHNSLEQAVNDAIDVSRTRGKREGIVTSDLLGVLGMASESEDGKFVSPNFIDEQNGKRGNTGLRSGLPNNGAPSDLPPNQQRWLIDWAMRNPNLVVGQKILKKHKEGNGQMKASDWNALRSLHRNVTGGSGMRSGSGLRSGRDDANDLPNMTPTGEGQLMGPERIKRGERDARNISRMGEMAGESSSTGSEQAGRGRPMGSGGGLGDSRLKGKKFDEVKPKDWDSMSVDDQYEWLLNDGSKSRSGMSQAAYDNTMKEILAREEKEQAQTERAARRAERAATPAKPVDQASEAVAAAEKPIKVKPRPDNPDAASKERKKDLSTTKKFTDRIADRAVASSNKGKSDDIHRDAWEEIASIMDTEDLTKSQIKEAIDRVDKYLKEAAVSDDESDDSLEFQDHGEKLKETLEKLQKYYSKDKFISDAPSKPEPKPANTAEVKPPASYTAYLSARAPSSGGLRSGKTGRTEIKEEATFFRDVEQSLPKEIQAARSGGDRSTADALSMLQTIISRQEASKLGDRRTNAGRILMTQKEVDDVLDALMVSLDRQVEINGEKRQEMFSKLIDMMAKAAMGTFIDKTTEELQGRTVPRTSASGRTVNIQNLQQGSNNQYFHSTTECGVYFYIKRYPISEW